MRKVFLNNLPTKQGFGYTKNKLVIDWKNSVGHVVEFIYKDIEGRFKIIEYIPKGQKIILKYMNKKYSLFTTQLLTGSIGGIVGVKSNEFKVSTGTWFRDNRRDIIITDRIYRKDKNYRKWYKYKCNKCGWDEGWIEEYHLINRNGGCSCCNGKTTVKGINDIPTTAPWMVKYFQGGYDEAKKYTKSSNKKIYPICPDCGRIKDKAISINRINYEHSIGCNCSDTISYPNKFIRYLMYQLKEIYPNLEYEFEYRREWTQRRSYDCWFKYNNKEYFVEMDGELGHGNKSHPHSQQTTEDTIYIDIYKNNLAKSQNITMIRIDCYYKNTAQRFAHIKHNILKSTLANIFNLTLIDFNIINNKCLDNIVKEICEYRKNNPNKTTREIAKDLNYGQPMVRAYLKIGDKIGWCQYDPIEEQLKSNNTIYKAINVNKIPIICLDNNIIFDSANDCERKSQAVFGTKMQSGSISHAIKHRIPYKGFHFLKVKEYEKMTKQEINIYLNKKSKKKVRIDNRVINVTTNEIFASPTIVEQLYGIRVRNCKPNKINKKTGCIWMYYEDFKKSNINLCCQENKIINL